MPIYPLLLLLFNSIKFPSQRENPGSGHVKRIAAGITMKKTGQLEIILRIKLVVLFGGLFTACQVVDAQRGSADFVNFEKFALEESMRGGGVEVADMDGDGLTDIIAMFTNPDQFAWFKNPSWEKFVISTVASGGIDSAPMDIDADGDMDIVLASDFALGRSTEGGLLNWLENPGNPTQIQEWEMHYIDEVPTSHRVKWGDINGDGELELVNLPIIGFGAEAPLYDVGLQLKAYAIPDNLNVDSWPGVILDQSLELSHGLELFDWDGNGKDDILSASFGGVHLFQLATQGQAVAKTAIAAGKQGADRPDIGSSEIDVGALNGTRFVATVEPWHGNEVVVYTAGVNSQALWNRQVIETELVDGHGLLTADLNNDGMDEIIAGGRSEPYQLYIYRFVSDSGEWNRIDLDVGGIALSGLAIEDLNGDGYTDIIGIGSATQNVVYYENSGR